MDANLNAPEANDQNGRLKIYFLPNLFTAGNLFCGFLALTKIVEAEPGAANFNSVIRHALFLILLACIFDLFDGRVARMGGRESPLFLLVRPRRSWCIASCSPTLCETFPNSAGLFPSCT
jgi:hypothetical protein